MARRKNSEAGRLLGQALTPLWEAQGEPSFRSMERALVGIMGVEMAPSAEQLRRMHHGETDPWTCSYEALMGVARYYGVEPDRLGPVVAMRRETAVSLTGQNWKISSGEHSSLAAA